MFKAVLFDWDGTLADTRRVIVDSFQKALSDVQVKIEASYIERRIGIGAEETFREILQKAGKPFDDALIKKLLEKKIQVEIDRSDDVKLFDGATELLESLHGRVKMALASMNNRAVIHHMLKTMHLQKFFDVVLTVEQVQKFKPDPEIFLKCALKLESSPDECVVVEDSIFGVQAAKVAGMACVAVLTGVYSRKELEKTNPDLIVHSLKQKKKIIDYILQ